MIDVRANDVVLDLGSFVMNQPDATLMTGRVAIQISGPTGSGASNVTVQNGTIRGFMGFAEEFEDGSFFAALNILSGSDLITIQNLRFIETGADASFTTGSVDTTAVRAFFISNLIVRQSFFDRVRGNGLNLASVQGLIVEDVLMTNFLPWVFGSVGQQYMFGINMNEFPDTSVSNDITIRRVILEEFNNAALNESIMTVETAGVFIFNPNVPVAPVVGTVGHNILIEDVLARGFSATGAITSVTEGVTVSGSVNFEVSPGVRSDPVGGVFRRIVVQDLAVSMPVTRKSEGVINGIQAFCQGCVMEDCVVQNLVYTGEANPSAGLGIIGVLPRGDGFVLRRCSVMGLDGTRFGYNPNVDVTGIQTCICGVAGGLIEENYSGSNVADPSSETATGFAILSTTDTVVRNNVAADNNYDGFFAIDETVPSQNNLYQSNTVTGSTFAGFWDLLTGSNSAYIDNFARSAQFNYLLGFPPFVFPLYGAQIVQWTIPEPAPTANITKLTNLSVSP